MISQCHPSSSSKMLPGALDRLEGESWQESGGERKVLCHGGAAQPGTETLPNIRVKAPGMSSAEPSHLPCKAIQGVCWVWWCCKCCALEKKKNQISWEVSASGQWHRDRERDWWEECSCWVRSYHTKQQNIEASREEELTYQIIKVGKALKSSPTIPPAPPRPPLTCPQVPHPHIS